MVLELKLSIPVGRRWVNVLGGRQRCLTHRGSQRPPDAFSVCFLKPHVDLAHRQAPGAVMARASEPGATQHVVENCIWLLGVVHCKPSVNRVEPRLPPVLNCFTLGMQDLGEPRHASHAKERIDARKRHQT